MVWESACLLNGVVLSVRTSAINGLENRYGTLERTETTIVFCTFLHPTVVRTVIIPSLSPYEIVSRYYHVICHIFNKFFF